MIQIIYNFRKCKLIYNDSRSGRRKEEMRYKETQGSFWSGKHVPYLKYSMCIYKNSSNCTFNMYSFTECQLHIKLTKKECICGLSMVATPIILASWEGEIEESQFETSPGKKS
jgi:hypothetical protein